LEFVICFIRTYIDELRNKELCALLLLRWRITKCGGGGNFGARNILNLYDGNPSRAPIQELEANARVMRKMLRCAFRIGCSLWVTDLIGSTFDPIAILTVGDETLLFYLGVSYPNQR
jgi:hypothetical protein